MNCGTEQILRHIGFVGKIDARLDERQRFDQSQPPRLGAIADQPFELAKRLPPLCRRFRGNEIGETFNRREIEPAIFERATRELAGLGQTAPLDHRQCVEYGSHHRMPAVQLQLRDILAGLAVRRGEPQRQRLIDPLARRRMPHPHQRRLARLRHAANKLSQRDACVRT